jgi:hypothetical protein
MRRCARSSLLFAIAAVLCGSALAPAAPAAAVPPSFATADGYRGIWYMNQPQADRFKYKYSGGFATYPQQHVPMAVYAAAANKTFFCYGGKTGDENRISNMVSYYDHATGTVPRPTIVLSRDTNDTHYNPTLTIDAKGYVYLFCNSHGAGGAASGKALAKSLIFRSAKPYAIDAFEQVYEGNFSYSQAWAGPERGILWLHTRYDGNHRRLFFSTTEDGTTWSDPSPLARMASGSYQISWAQSGPEANAKNAGRVATALDHHPEKGGLNARTNIYYLETNDFGKTWTTAAGAKIDLPLTETTNTARIRDFEKEGLLVYLKDLTFDAASRPVILFLTSKSYKSGPDAGPRQWQTARWTGRDWRFHDCFTSDHNYDHGSLYLEADSAWRIIAPTEPGPQPDSTGGQITVHTSRDEGQTWQKEQTFPLDNARNQTYVRRPWHAHDDFYGFWADGDALEPSESDLYFCTRAGKVFRLPRKMTEQTARPQAVGN